VENESLNILIVEDSSERIEWFKTTFKDCNIFCTDKVYQACYFLKHCKYDIIFLDRDLGEGKRNGEYVTSFLANHKKALESTIIIHSSNIIARQRMQQSLESYHNNVMVIDFIQLKKMKREDFKLSS
jgi:hypothetical protein